jgi:hypothetical protein
MVYQHRFQAARFELKYIVDESRAIEVRNFARSYLIPDEHADPRAGNSYPVHSLYLDSPDLCLFRSTVEGLKNRFKLRIRFYDDHPAHPVFLEIKRRLSDVICKERACVRRGAVDMLLRGIRPGASLSASPSDREKNAASLHAFWQTCRKIGARAAAYISYQREAYVSPASDQVRVTFDRQITTARYAPRLRLRIPRAPAPVDMRGVVLEMKFTDRFPNWMREMVHALDLWRCPSAKYVAGVRVLGYPWIKATCAGLGVA